ncbi:Hsp20 family protein [Pseudodesulfovibrio sp. F-1]|uniref:Hsp20 family protein n=1 Tax=Pseudodesulfovibrio alkaliphilus TaxID=2661613 RepID=A0A7K1KQT3_9BACT|nr:Hsp20 family protein [Pseudodesulfovibrio alkaliphilus]MUM78444.1 Hsp20 family protein [Pseudodesulfovibrio alkaliphilus]
MADLKRWSRGEITRMRLEIDRLFDELCLDFDLPAMVCRMTGDIELWEEDDALVCRMELGAIDPDDVTVMATGRLLAITAEVSEVEGSRRRSRAFRREIRLPCAIRADEVEVAFADSVLLVRLPRCTRQHIVRIIKK